MERDNILKDKQEKMQSPIGGVDNDFQLGESKYSFYVILRRWAEKPLGFGRCGKLSSYHLCYRYILLYLPSRNALR